MGQVSTVRPSAVRDLTFGLERIGWEIRNIDIDHVAGRFVVEVHRFDGRWLYLTGDADGRVSLERWHRTAVVTRYRGGPQCDSFKDDFLGRSRPEGVRSGLRSLSSYIAENPAPGFSALPVANVRALLAPLLDGAG